MLSMASFVSYMLGHLIGSMKRICPMSKGHLRLAQAEETFKNELKLFYNVILFPH